MNRSLLTNNGALGEPVRKIGISRKPTVNMLPQEEFNKRAALIFELIDDILGKSFGPYGAPTIISDYPYMDATKDGFTIARNIVLDHVIGSQVDRVIYKIMMDICGRVNYMVGDGTTTAIVATNQLYKAISSRDELKNMPSREVLSVLIAVKDAVIEEFEKEVVPVTEDTLIDTIRKVTYVSSNADDTITDMITATYEKYRYPVVKCDLSDSAATYVHISNGFSCKVWLGDKIYINTDRKYGDYENLNALVFGCQVNDKVWANVIKPLADFINVQRGAGITTPMKLLIIAPSYDETTLNITIKQYIMDYYRRHNEFNLILMSYPRNNDGEKQAVNDLAMLLGTEILTRDRVQDIIDRIDTDVSIFDVVDMRLQSRGVDAKPGLMQIFDQCIDIVQKDKSQEKFILNVGYADALHGSFNEESEFKVSIYDKGVYQKYLDEAKASLDAVVQKYAILGTYTPDVIEARRRYTSLMMESATIYVGGDSKLSQDMRASAVEDAIRAAESTYHNGYVLGGNVTLIRAARNVAEEYRKHAADSPLATVEAVCAEEFAKAFVAVYKRVFNNCEVIKSAEADERIEECVRCNTVFDLRTMTYSKDIINSAKTDIEVLTASIDMLRILLAGNQVLLMHYDHDNSLPEKG